MKERAWGAKTRFISKRGWPIYMDTPRIDVDGKLQTKGEKKRERVTETWRVEIRGMKNKKEKEREIKKEKRKREEKKILDYKKRKRETTWTPVARQRLSISAVLLTFERKTQYSRVIHNASLPWIQNLPCRLFCQFAYFTTKATPIITFL